MVPSQTELLYDLGLEERVVGVTKFCVHPKTWLKSKTIVGGTKKFRFEAIDALQPDLVIGNKEENYQEGIDALSQKYPVWMSDIEQLEDALWMVREVGKITGMSEKAKETATTIHQHFETLIRKNLGKALYLIWRRPYMAAGKNTFINDMLGRIGLENVMASNNRYPEISENRMRELDPDYVLLSSEPYPFKEQHLSEISRVCPDAKVMLADGEMFSWYGSRLVHAVAYFRQLFGY